jgi:TPR repeat protein
LHENGLGVDKDLTLAFRYYKKASEMGYYRAFSKCGDFLYCGKIAGGRKDKLEAFKYY